MLPLLFVEVVKTSADEFRNDMRRIVITTK
jgi:hypothetical protein